MKLKKNISIIDFMKVTKQCKGDVYFCTDEQDRLNLKSQLSQYVFAAVFFQNNIHKGCIICTLESDYLILSDYLKPSIKNEGATEL